MKMFLSFCLLFAMAPFVRGDEIANELAKLNLRIDRIEASQASLSIKVDRLIADQLVRQSVTATKVWSEQAPVSNSWGGASTTTGSVMMMSYGSGYSAGAGACAGGSCGTGGRMGLFGRRR